MSNNEEMKKLLKKAVSESKKMNTKNTSSTSSTSTKLPEGTVKTGINKTFTESLKETFGPEKIKKGFENVKTSVSSGITSIKTKMNPEDIKKSLTKFGTSVSTGISSGVDVTKEYVKEKFKPEKNVPISIKSIKNISQIIKDNLIYIDITNLLGTDYINKSITNSNSNCFETNQLLKTIVYSLLPYNSNDRARIIFFKKTVNANNYKLYVYNTQNSKSYIKDIKI